MIVDFIRTLLADLCLVKLLYTVWSISILLVVRS